MSSFTGFNSKLHITYAPLASKNLGKDMWLLEKEFRYYVGHYGSNNYVIVPAGFLSDSASIPCLARVFIPRMGSHTQASFLHDWLCENYFMYHEDDLGVVTKVALTRKEIDYIYFESLVVTDVSWWRRFFIRTGVNLFRVLFNPKKPIPYFLKRREEQRIKDETINL